MSAPEPLRCDQCDPSFGCWDASEPCHKRPAPEPLRRLAAKLVLQPCPHNPGSGTMMGECVNCCARLLERVVRRAAKKAEWIADAGVGAPRQIERGVLSEFGLAPSPESKKENR